MSAVFEYTPRVVDGRMLIAPRVGAFDYVGGLTVNPDPYAQSITQEFPLGTKLIEGERVWRYAKNGAGTPAAGDPLTAATILNAAADLDVVVDAASAIGATTVSITSQAAIACAANYFKEGYLFVNVGTGLGYSYKIKSHTALVSTTAGTIVTLYDPLVIAVATSSSKVGLRKNPYDTVIASAAVVSGAPIGVTPRVLTASYYFWCQTGGPCAVKANAAIAVGQVVYIGTTAAAADPPITDVKALTPIGYALSVPNTQNEYFLAFLTLDN